MRGFRWTGKREEAALLVAQDELSNEEIAKRVGITRQGLDKWKLAPEFQGRVDELLRAMADAVKGRGIAERQNRVDELNEEWDRLRRLRDARAAQYADVPGGDTGLLVRQVKVVRVAKGEERRVKGEVGEGGGGLGERGFVQVEEYAIDGVLLKELREHAKQAAQELGQWNTDGPEDDGVLVREYVGVLLEQV